MDVTKTEKPVVRDRSKDLLEHCIENIELDVVEYYEVEGDEDKIKIIITGSFSDEKQAEEFMEKTRKPDHEAYDRAMRGIV